MTEPLRSHDTVRMCKTFWVEYSERKLFTEMSYEMLNQYSKHVFGELSLVINLTLYCRQEEG